MKFTVARASLLKPLQAVIGVVERRQTMPVLANVLLAAQEGKLTITATDLEVELVAAIEIDTIDVQAISPCRAENCLIFVEHCQSRPL